MKFSCSEKLLLLGNTREKKALFNGGAQPPSSLMAVGTSPTAKRKINFSLLYVLYLTPLFFKIKKKKKTLSRLPLGKLQLDYVFCKVLLSTKPRGGGLSGLSTKTLNFLWLLLPGTHWCRLSWRWVSQGASVWLLLLHIGNSIFR